MEIAEQAVAHELVVEAQRVVTQGAGPRSRHLLEDAGERLGLVDTIALCALRGDAGDQGGDGRGQQVVGRLDHEVVRGLDFVQRFDGADRRELGDARAPRIRAEGFQVVEKEAGAHSGASGASRSTTCASTAAQSTPCSESRPRVASTRIPRWISLRSSASEYGMRMKVTIV